MSFPLLALAACYGDCRCGVKLPIADARLFWRTSAGRQRKDFYRQHSAFEGKDQNIARGHWLIGPRHARAIATDVTLGDPFLREAAAFRKAEEPQQPVDADHAAVAALADEIRQHGEGVPLARPGIILTLCLRRSRACLLTGVLALGLARRTFATPVT